MGSSKWTTADIPDQTGRVVVVTGANSGIGLVAARELAAKGAHVVMGCRNLTKGEAAVAEVMRAVPSASVELLQLDLASLVSVRAFAAEFRDRHDQLDIMANNAGIMMVPEGTTEDGFEKQFGTNHLGHFALTGLLFDLLAKTAGSRVVTVSSLAHEWGTFDGDDLMFENSKYTTRESYGRSKLANLLFTYELERRADEVATDSPLSLAAHPGISATNLGSHMVPKWLVKPAQAVMGLMLQSADMGALPTLRAATDPEAMSGQYYGPGGRNEQRGHPVVVLSNPASHSEEDAKVLWEKSEELTGVTFPFVDA